MELKLRYIALLFFVFPLLVNIAQAQEKIRLTNGEWKPYQSEDLSNFGPYSEIATLAFEKVGIEVEFGFFPWNRAMKLAESGRWDGTFFWVATDERRKNYLLSDPVITLNEVIYFSKNNPLNVSRIEDFSGLKMGRIQSSAFGQRFDSLINTGQLVVTVVPTNENLFKMLYSGRIDFIPELINSGYDAIDSLPDEIDKTTFTHLDEFKYPWVSHLLISKNIPRGPYYIDAFNRGFKMLVEEGTVAKILNPILKPKRSMVHQ